MHNVKKQSPRYLLKNEINHDLMLLLAVVANGERKFSLFYGAPTQQARKF
jgi:hypothetical protein